MYKSSEINIQPASKRTRRQVFPRKLVNQFAASVPSSNPEPDHSHTETPSVMVFGPLNDTSSTAIPGALTTAGSGGYYIS